MKKQRGISMSFFVAITILVLFFPPILRATAGTMTGMIVGDSLSTTSSAIKVPKPVTQNRIDGVIRVGVIDSGISTRAGIELTGGRNYITSDAYTADDSGHGTAVASILRAAAPDAELVSLKTTAKGELTSPDMTALAIRNAVDEFNCDILVMAFGQPDTKVLREAVAHAAAKGVILIAAVGNEGNTYRKNRIYYPAGYDAVIGIGSTNAKGTLSFFSQHGGVSFVACGEKLAALAVDGKLRTVSGTSFAAAAVAGYAAFLNMEEADDFLSILKNDARDLGAKGFDLCYGNGFIGCGAKEGTTK